MFTLRVYSQIMKMLLHPVVTQMFTLDVDLDLLSFIIQQGVQRTKFRCSSSAQDRMAILNDNNRVTVIIIYNNLPE